MTNIAIKNDVSNWDIKIEGHAGYGPKGSDIVCAAISTLSTMIAQELMIDSEDVKIYRYVMDEENAMVHFIFDAVTDSINNKIQMAILGFELISNNYPEFVRLTLK